jgi:uncharacterized iron-regulated membrane protein
MKLRVPALILHRYAGILAGVLLIVIGLTGSLLVFSEELDHFLHPQLLQVVPQAQQISVQQIVDVAQKRFPDLKPHRIIVPDKPDRVYTVLMVSSKDEFTDVYINPYNAQVTGSRPFKQTVSAFLIEAHVHLFAGDFGMQLVGVCGGILLLLGVTGLILWNGWNNLKHNLKIRWKSPKQLLNYDLHKLGGTVSVALLSLIAFTGTMMIFWTPVEAALYRITNTPPLPELKSTVVANVTPMQIDELLQKAQATLPDAKMFKVFPAKKPEDTFSVWMKFPQENEFNKTPFLYFDQYTGELLRIDNSKQASLANRILNAQYVLHVGHYGGIVTKILYSLIGIFPLGLFVTGVIIWR